MSPADPLRPGPDAGSAAGSAAGPATGPATGPGAPPGSPSGVIHDIGYRRYTGRRLGRAYAVRSLFGHSLRAAFGLGRAGRSKVMPTVLFGIMVTPAAVIVAVINVVGMDSQPVAYTRYAMLLRVVVGLFLAAQAPALVARDLRSRTITLYLSRPLTRVDYVVAKYAAMAAALFVLMAVPLAILYAGGLLAKFPLGRETGRFALGLVGALAFALVLSGLGLLLAALTTRRGLGVAIIIATLAVTDAGVAIVSGVASMRGNDQLAAYAHLCSPFGLVNGFQAWALGADSATPPPGTTGGVVFTLAMLAAVAATGTLLRLRYERLATA